MSLSYIGLIFVFNVSLWIHVLEYLRTLRQPDAKWRYQNENGAFLIEYLFSDDLPLAKMKYFFSYLAFSFFKSSLDDGQAFSSIP